MATLDDLLTAQKNGVVAINRVANSNLRGQGTQTSATVTADTLVLVGAGYLVGFTVIVAGTGATTVYDSKTIAGVTAANALFTGPTTVGFTKIGHVFSDGLVIKIGTGQSVNITYYVG